MRIFSKKQTDNAPRRRQSDHPREEARNSAATFRRNQTIAGSSSSAVTPAGSVDFAGMTSSRTELHSLRHTRRRLIAILCMVFAGAIITYTILSQIIAHAALRPRGDITTQLVDYNQTVQEYFAQHPLERLKPLTNQDQLLKFLQRTHAEIADLKVGASIGPGISEFVVTLRHPIAGWTIHNKQQYVDDTGVAFSRNYFPEPSLQVIDKSNIDLQGGKAVASNRFLGFTGRVVGLLKAEKYTVKEILIPQNTVRQISVRLAEVAYPIKLSVDRPAGEQVEDAIAAIKWLRQKGITPEYVDVRVSGRAYYR